MHPQETIGQDATVEERPQLPFHKARHHAIALVLPVQERFQIPGDDSCCASIAIRVSFVYCECLPLV
jgi:hypothetical protein